MLDSSNSPSVEIEVYPDYDALSRAAAGRLRSDLAHILDAKTHCAVALVGGSTPQRLYELLAEEDLPWERIHLYWGDERVVPHTHPKSNVHLIRKSLLNRIAIPERNVHPMPTDGDPEGAAATYEETLRQQLAEGPHTFDIVLLGLGKDGHTASLFPEHDPSPHDPNWVRAVTAPPRHVVDQRLTCTLPVLNKARESIFIVSGTSKRDAVQGVLKDRDRSLPATHIRPHERLVWLLDEDARPHGMPPLS